MNTWRSRLLVAAVLWLSLQAHGMSTAALPNTPQGMLYFHGSAAFVELILLYCVPKVTSGRLCDDLQAMFIASIVVNFLGWIAYLAYAPPIYFNTIAWGLAYVQWARLLLVDRNDDYRLGFNLVRGADRSVA